MSQKRKANCNVLYKPPTTEQFTAYQKAWEYFNEKLFDGQLRPCLLNFSRRHKAKGFFWADKWTKADTTCHEISLNPDVLERPVEEIMSTLAHEMAHQWQQDHGQPSRTGYHNREWAERMEQIGLFPSQTGEPGGKKTGQHVTHYIDPNGLFKRAFDQMPEEYLIPWRSGRVEQQRRKSRNQEKTTYRCSCGSTIWGKADLLVKCKRCGKMFRQSA
jgi:predicted SprT family Zn-dependent metalloprotease